MKKQTWEVSLIAFQEGEKRKYKVTRRLPSYSVAETTVFSSRTAAEKQFKQWLQ